MAHLASPQHLPRSAQFFLFTETLFPEGSYSILLNPSLPYRVRDTRPKPKVPGTSESLLIFSPMIPKYTSTQLIPEHKHNRDRRRLRRAFRARDVPTARQRTCKRARVRLPSATAPPSRCSRTPHRGATLTFTIRSPSAPIIVITVSR